MYSIVSLNIKHARLKVLYSAIPTEEETKILFKHAVLEKESDEDAILILPWTAGKTYEDSDEAKKLARKYRPKGLTSNSLYLIEYATLKRRIMK